MFGVCTVKSATRGETGNYRIFMQNPPEGGNSIRVDKLLLMVYGVWNDEEPKWHYFPMANVIKYSTEGYSDTFGGEKLQPGTLRKGQ